MSLLHHTQTMEVLNQEFQEAMERRRAQRDAIKNNTILSLESELEEALAFIERDFLMAKANIEIRWLSAKMDR